jgi:hypothetical protein
MSISSAFVFNVEKKMIYSQSDWDAEGIKKATDCALAQYFYRLILNNRGINYAAKKHHRRNMALS